MHRARPYFRDLLPWLLLSAALHAGTALATLVKWGITTTEGGFAVERFATPAGAESSPPDLETARVKRYRLNYFPKVAMLLPDPPPIVPEPEPEPEPLPIPKPDAPAAPTQRTPPPAAPAIPPTIPLPTGGSSNAAYRGPTGVETGELKDENGVFLHMPAFELTAVRDGLIRTDQDFRNHPTIYVLSDLSTETGLEDLFTWTRFYHDLMHKPGVVEPPWFFAIGTALQDEFFLTPDLAEESLRSRWETVDLFPGPLWGDGAYDAKRYFADGFALEELPVPYVYLADWEGNVRVKITGRLEDLDREQVTAVITEVKNLWGMDDAEFFVANMVALTWHSQLQAGTLTEPSPAEGIELIPPPPGRLPEDPPAAP